MEHTKGKLTCDGWNGKGGFCIWDEKLNHIFTAEMPYPMDEKSSRANTHRLVACWNSHDELLKACKFAKAQIKKGSPKKALPVLRAAIAEAEKGKE